MRSYRAYDMFAGDEAWRARVAAWFAACGARDSAVSTSMPAEFFIDAYEGYAAR
jgi:hypothetical protein